MKKKKLKKKKAGKKKTSHGDLIATGRCKRQYGKLTIIFLKLMKN
jgi:hypothetical protein